MLRTNFDKKDLKRYELAISEFKAKTGSNRLSIQKEAHDVHERLIENAMSLHDSENGELSLFWAVFFKINTNECKRT